MVAVRQVKNDAECQANAARLQLRLQQNQSNAQRKMLECQERKKLKLHAQRMKVLRRKEEARYATLQIMETNLGDSVQEAWESEEVSSTACDSGEEVEQLPTTVGLEERPDGSFRLLINTKDVEHAATSVVNCFKV